MSELPAGDTAAVNRRIVH